MTNSGYPSLLSSHGTTNWESKFTRWASPPGKSEQQRCENAENSVRNAIRRNEKLNRRDIRIFTHGSYRNRVNVSTDSDVDVGIECRDVFFGAYPEGSTAATFGLKDGSYTYEQFKSDVGDALVDYFGAAAVTRGNKAFDIKENTYHVEADVTAFFEHRRYSKNGKYISGVELSPDNAPYQRVINWPEQHYNNGVDKNSHTSRRYKGVVRILKSLRAELDAVGKQAARVVPGFLIECLVWNVPDEHFGHTTWKADVRATLAYLWNNTRTDNDCTEWGEVSELKYLFRGTRPWTRQQAHDFLDAAWNYLGFE